MRRSNDGRYKRLIHGRRSHPIPPQIWTKEASCSVRRRMMKLRAWTILAVTALLLLTTVGCRSQLNQPEERGSGAPAEVGAGVISALTQSDAQQHEEIAPQVFTDGEHIDNPYYKRTTDEAGKPVFAVIKSADGQPAYLPFDQTTVYHTQTGPCFYEKKTLSYLLDGMEQTADCYELWVMDTVADESTAANATPG